MRRLTTDAVVVDISLLEFFIGKKLLEEFSQVSKGDRQLLLLLSKLVSEKMLLEEHFQV